MAGRAFGEHGSKIAMIASYSEIDVFTNARELAGAAQAKCSRRGPPAVARSLQPREESCC